MINCLILNADNEFVTIYEIKETIVNGASVIKPKLKKENHFVSMQSTTSIHSVGGIELVNQIQGDKKTEVKIVYSPNYNMVVGDLIKTKDNVLYEVQAIDHKGRGTLLHHDVYYVTKCENQKILRNLENEQLSNS